MQVLNVSSFCLQMQDTKNRQKFAIWEPSHKHISHKARVWQTDRITLPRPR